ncbi:hypothetical protein ACFGVS_01075 [Mucilaginibacter sp. AW1-7]|uniref:hypothetical protein n=1 Tax=Mucilaginibacter sp. AW1-7 TaxID=3349874 RepID=UPI003F7333F3
MMYKKIWPTIIILVFSLTTFAQGIDEPCGGSDPLDNNCPLDTGIIYLVLLAAVFATVQLGRGRPPRGQMPGDQVLAPGGECPQDNRL